MASISLPCPKCRVHLDVPQPAPELMNCPYCGVKFRLKAPAASPAKPSPPVVPNSAVATQGTATLVAGHEVQRELTRGGLGVVYLAYHPRLNAQRAIKRPLRGDGSLDRDIVLARFTQEMQAVADIHNPHVVRVFAADEDAEGPYLVMEYLDGEPLSSLVARHGPLPIPEACELIRQAAVGLQAAHENGLVHRDVKPSNLMLARTKASGARVVLIDWGLVKQSSETGPVAKRLTKLGAMMGTPDYVAPEQIRDAQSVDIRADIYSLGFTLYYLLAGQPPFAGLADDQKLVAHGRGAFPALERLRPDIPPELLAAIRTMVRKERNERYSTPGEVADALQQFCCREPHRLLALFAPSLPQSGPASTGNYHLNATDMGAKSTPAVAVRQVLPSAEPTVMAQPYAVATAQPTQRGGYGLWLALAGGGAFFAVLMLLVVVLLLSTGKGVDTGKASIAAGPQVLIDENFRSAAEKRLTLPEGWKGDAFRVVRDNVDQPCLETSKPTGIPELVPPPLAKPLSGNFSAEAVYVMGHPAFGQYHTLAFVFASTQGKKPLAVVVDWSGQVLINDDPRLPPPNYKPLKPTHFLVTRQGNKLSFYLDEEPVGTKDLDEVVDYDTLTFRLAAGPGNSGVLARVYKLKVVSLGESGVTAGGTSEPLPQPSPKTPKRKGG